MKTAQQTVLAISLATAFSAVYASTSQSTGNAQSSEDNHASAAANSVLEINSQIYSGSLKLPADLQVKAYQPKISQSYDWKNNAESISGRLKLYQPNITHSYDLNNHSVLLAENTVTETQTDANSGSLNKDDTPIKETANTANATELPSITVKGERQRRAAEVYQSGATIRYNDIQNRPNGNGDITSTLKVLPNVQFNNSQMSSNTPGEIDPADISISGGLYYQNNFQVDGFNINNDLFSNGEYSIGDHNTTRWGAAKSQGLALDTSLIDSVTVYDSNIPASEGGFTGGVVKATTKKPDRDGIHGQISWQHTGDHWTKAFVDDEQVERYRYNTSELYQPDFTKNIYRASLEGKLNDQFSVIGSYSSTNSKIPVYVYSKDAYKGDLATERRNQKREIDNYFLKAYWTPRNDFSLEGSITYAPQKNTFFRSATKNSFWTLDSGGLDIGLKAEYDSSVGKWTNQLQYSDLDSTRQFDSNIYTTWRAAGGKNWAYSATSANPTTAEGGFGLMEQTQRTIGFRTQMDFAPWKWKNTTHNFSTGLEFENQKITRARSDYWQLSYNNTANLNGQACGMDSFGLNSCDSSPLLNPVSGQMWDGQYFTKIYRDKARKWDFTSVNFGLFLQDDIQFDLNKYGELNVRPGVRLDKNTYMDDIPIAPRFSMNYKPNWGKDSGYQSGFTFGANRYYARNQYSYKLNSYLATGWDEAYIRDNPNEPWRLDPQGDLSYYVDFDKLKTPYADELMFGYKQDLGLFNAELKYIKRKGKDEIISRRDNPPKAGMYSDYWTWSNDGSSTSDIISLQVANSKPLEFLGGKHSILFGFDKTKTKRGYNPIFTFSEDNNKTIDDNFVMYNGSLIKYNDRPVENFATPWTMRLATTHQYKLWGADVSLSNIFRLRDAYEGMVLTGYEGRCVGTNTVASRCPGQPLYEYDTYEKMKFSRAFTWDMRLGLEKKIYKDNALFVNLDIYNVLNKKNATSRSTTAGRTVFNATSTANVPVYETGRQFWLQLGYKF